MRKIFFDILEVNIVVTVTGLVFCLLAGKLRSRYGAGWMKLLWLLLAVRLLIPYNVSFPFIEIRFLNYAGFGQGSRGGISDENTDFDGQAENGLKTEPEVEGNNKSTAAGKETEPGSLETEPGEWNHTAFDEAPDKKNDGRYLSVKQPENPAGNLSADRRNNPEGSREASFYTDILVKIWLIGIAASLLFLAGSYQFFYTRCRKTLRPVGDASLIRKSCVLQKKYIGKVKVPIYQSAAVSSPMLTGVMRQRLILPARREKWKERELDLIMAHEFCHYQKKDLWLKLFMAVVNAIYWFNPVVYRIKRQFAYDMELACDESVLKNKNEKEREAYAKLMLSFAGRKKDTGAFSTGFGEKKRWVKERIDFMFDTKERKKGRGSIVMVIAMILIMGFTVSCGYKQEDRERKEEDKKDSSYQRESLEGAAANKEPQNGQTEDKVFKDTAKGEETETFNYNHEYNEIIRVYQNNVYLARENGIYYIEGGEGEEELLFENTYGLRRGMEIERNFLYFCGSVQRGGENAATIYRMNLDTRKTVDLLAAFSQKYEALYGISIYEGNLYVAEGYEQRIGFALNQEGEIAGLLDKDGEDFLYKEYNDYMALELAKLNSGVDTDEYWRLVEEQESKYQAVVDVAACKKMLQGRQVVRRYKDELMSGIYFENEDGAYEHLCDAVGFPMLVTETGLYYFASEGEIWYIDFETRQSEKFFARQSREWAEISLANYDKDYVYILQKRDIGYDRENNRVEESCLLRVPRTGGGAQKVYWLEENTKTYGSGWYRHCGVYNGRMFFDGQEAISLDPDENGMERENNNEKSEDALAMEQTARDFASAYFHGDRESLEMLLAEDFSESIDFYPYPENAGQIEETYIGGLPEGNLPVGVCSRIFYEYKGDVEAAGAKVYLDMEMVKTEQGWKIKWYGIEM